MLSSNWEKVAPPLFLPLLNVYHGHATALQSAIDDLSKQTVKNKPLLARLVAERREVLVKQVNISHACFGKESNMTKMLSDKVWLT